MKLLLFCLVVVLNISYIFCDRIAQSELFKKLKKYQDIDLFHKRLDTDDKTSKWRDGLQGQLQVTPVYYRLPGDINPRHYDVSLQVYHWGNESFLGCVTMEFEALGPVSTITLHSAKLAIQDMKLLDSVNATLDIIEANEIPEGEQLDLLLRNPLVSGHNYSLTIHYRGFVRSDSLGLYAFGYVDKAQRVSLVAATQFQATFARHVFPCLDEPDYKARFSLHIARPSNSTAISNTPLLMTAPFLGFPEYEWDTFEKTVQMSTYLLAFVVSQFRAVSTTIDGIDYKVYMKPDHYEEGLYTLEQTPKFIKYFEKFYGIPYPLSKLDSVGLQQMAATGMENWGLVLYDENAIRVRNSTNARQLLASSNLIAHEVAHQWFGNLVTAHWWSDIWLNEGFASYMALKAIEMVSPTWESMKLFVSGHQMTALALDSTHLSTPIIQNVSSVDEIDSTFNIITYSKGASLIRMMDHFLTSETFRKGVRNYLLEYQYDNAEQDDLWRHLTEAARQDGTLPGNANVKEIMDTWTLQKHYPVVNIHRHANGSTTISQEQFSTERSNMTDGLWWIPVSVLAEGAADAESTTPTIWLPPKKKSMFIAGLPSLPRWVILNIQQTAYARINYDKQSWMSLVRQLRNDHSIIPVTTRAQLLDDAYHLFKEDNLEDPSVLFTLMSYMSNEVEYLPWVITIRNMEDIHDHLLYQPEYFEFKTYLLKLSSKLYFKFGLEREVKSSLEGLFSLRAQKWTCQLQQTSCITDLKNYFTQWQERQDMRVVPHRLRPAVMCTGIREGNATLWDAVWSAAKAVPSNSKYRTVLLKALGCSKETWTLKRYLLEGFKERRNLGLNGLVQIVESVALNPVSHDYAWELIKDSTRFKNRFGGEAPHPVVLKAATLTLNKRRHLEELAKFVRDNPMYAKADIQSVVKKVAGNIRWLEKYHKPIARWLVDNYPFEKIRPIVPITEMPKKSFRTPRKYDIRLIE